MNADQLEKRWAAKRLGISVKQIQSVHFEDEPETAYSTITVEPATTLAVVRTATETHTIDLHGRDFGELLREILDA
jgi:hypothetical protein